LVLVLNGWFIGIISFLLLFEYPDFKEKQKNQKAQVRC